MRFILLHIRPVALLVLLIACGMPALAATKIEAIRSPGGIEAWLVRDTMLPVLAMQFAWRGGAAADPAAKAGRANMAVELLTEGAGDLDSQAFAAELENRVISLDFDAGLDTVQGSLKTLNEHRDVAIDLLRLALAQPRFDPSAVERMRARVLAALARDTEEPNTLARRTWMATAYPDHPYGRPVRGSVETVSSLTADDFRSFVRERLARDNLIIGVVGDIAPEELGPLLDRAFGALPAKAAPVDIQNRPPAGGGRMTVVPRSIPQSVIVFGEDGIKRSDPDWYAASIVNYVLGGGGFNSRLMTELREKRGLTYGIYTSLSSLDHSTLLLGSGSTRNAAAAQALEVIRTEWRRMAEEGPTPEEIEGAKSYLTGSFALQLDSTSRIASMLVSIQYDDLGIDFIERRNDLINAVTVDDARRVARRLLDPERLLTVIVGEPAGLAEGAPGAAAAPERGEGRGG